MSPESAKFLALGKALQKERGRTPIGEAARIVNLDRTTWFRIEKGEREPVMTTYLKMTDSIGLFQEEIINIMGLSITTDDSGEAQPLWDRLTLSARNPAREVSGTFSDRLKTYREGLGISHRNLGMRTGLHYSQISRLESKNRTPRVSTVTRLALGLRLSPEQTLALIAPFKPEQEVYASQ